MIIECPYCESKVDGLVKGEHQSFDPNEDPAPFKVVLLQCPVCKNALVGGTELIQVGKKQYEWSTLSRLWPKEGYFIRVEASSKKVGSCFTFL